jgi:hypothetical protein
MKNDDILFTEYVLLYDDGRSDLCHERLTTSILKFIKNNKIDKYIKGI